MVIDFHTLFFFFVLRISELATFVSRTFTALLGAITVGEVTMRDVDVAHDASP
jgi:hypothetical protein